MVYSICNTSPLSGTIGVERDHIGCYSPSSIIPNHRPLTVGFYRTRVFLSIDIGEPLPVPGTLDYASERRGVVRVSFDNRPIADRRREFVERHIIDLHWNNEAAVAELFWRASGRVPRGRPPFAGRRRRSAMTFRA